MIPAGPDERRAAFDSVPINRHLGLRLISSSAEEAVLSLAVRPQFLQEGGIVHGGILSTLADTAAVYTLYPGLPADRVMTSIEFKLNFLRPVPPEGGDVTARARVVQRGRKVGVCDVELTQADRPVARGLFTYLFFEAEPGG